MIEYTEQVTIDKEEAINMQMEVDNNLVCIEDAVEKLRYLSTIHQDVVSAGYMIEIGNRITEIRTITERLWKS